MEENYLYSELEKGRNIKVIYMSHNAYVSYFRQLDMDFKNLDITIFGGSAYCIENRGYNEHILEDCDFILLYSSSVFDEDELAKLKEIAFKVSNEKEKRVSIGYSYVIPIEKRSTERKNITEDVQFVSIFNNEIVEKTLVACPYFDSVNLMNMVMKLNDELENKKIDENRLERNRKK